MATGDMAMDFHSERNFCFFGFFSLSLHFFGFWKHDYFGSMIKGGSCKDRTPRGELGCCDSWMAEGSH